MIGLGLRVGRSMGEKYNPDANLLFTDAGITNSQEKTLISNWFNSTIDLRAAGDIIKAYNISKTSFSSSLFDWISRTQCTFTDGNSPNWSNEDGWFFNGVNKFLNSLVNASTGTTLNNVGLIVWSLEDAPQTAIDMGCNNGATSRLTLGCENASNLTRFGAYNDATILSPAAGVSLACYSAYVLSSTSRKVYRNLTEISDSGVSVAGTPPNLNMYMGANNNAGVAGSFKLGKIALIQVTKGLNLTKHTTLYNANLAWLQGIGRIA